MKLLSMRIDLMDAFDDQGVGIEVIANIEDIDGDIVVVCAGVSSQEKLIDRRAWGRANRNVYESIAETCSRKVPNAFFVIVSNPVELAVRIFSERLGDAGVSLAWEQNRIPCVFHERWRAILA